MSERRSFKIALLPGDGIGREVIPAARAVLEAVGRRFQLQFQFEEHLIGGAAIDVTGTALPEDTLAGCRQADAVLLGAVGGPAWDDPQAAVRPEQGLLGMRQGLALYANLRPIRPHLDLAPASPLKPERLAGVDLLIVRELTGGVYFGQPRGRATDEHNRIRAFDTMAYWDFEIERIAHLAFRLARERRAKVTSVDKANVLESSRLWRQVTSQVGEGYPDVELEHQLVDSAAMRLITAPASFDVVLTSNLFGDILADEAAVLTGSLGNLPSAALGEGALGMYEPVHGSAPDIAGRGVANPVGTVLSAAMMLRHSLQLSEEAQAVEDAVDRALSAGLRTADLGGELSVGTQAMTEAIVDRI